MVDLDLDGFDGSSEGCHDADADTLQAGIDDPAGYYVNVHNAAFPGGAIRGQLAPASPNTALPSGGSPLVLLGLQLVAIAGASGVRLVRSTVTR